MGVREYTPRVTRHNGPHVLPANVNRATSARVADDAADRASGPVPIEGPASPGQQPAVKVEVPESVVSRARRRLTPQHAGLAIALAALCMLLAVEIRFIATETSPSPRPSASSSPAESRVPMMAPAPRSAASTEIDTAPATASREEIVDDEPRPAKPEKPRRFGTVEEASVGSCSTASVDGLSRQIVDQVRCINPNALVPLPARPNLVLDTHTFPYLESSARNHFLRVLDAHRDQTMKVHSVLRTVAQQYLVWRWAAGKRCGVQMATPPGDSNHETGRALDIGGEARWRPALEAEGFHWLGATDNVHFDFMVKGNGSSPQHGLDVLAFQRLWNRNHRDDPITENGRYDPGTEQRLRKAPATGFPVGPSCGKRALMATAPRKAGGVVDH
jgi:hypothetical protein